MPFRKRNHRIMACIKYREEQAKIPRVEANILTNVGNQNEPVNSDSDTNNANIPAYEPVINSDSDMVDELERTHRLNNPNYPADWLSDNDSDNNDPLPYESGSDDEIIGPTSSVNLPTTEDKIVALGKLAISHGMSEVCLKDVISWVRDFSPWVCYTHYFINY